MQRKFVPKKKLSKWIYGELKVQNVTERELARELRIHPNTLTNKLNTQSFSYAELGKIFHYFNADTETVARLMRG